MWLRTLPRRALNLRQNMKCCATRPSRIARHLEYCRIVEAAEARYAADQGQPQRSSLPVAKPLSEDPVGLTGARGIASGRESAWRDHLREPYGRSQRSSGPPAETHADEVVRPKPPWFETSCAH